MVMHSFQGSTIALTLYDVCDEIGLSDLAPLIGKRKLVPPLKHTIPPFVRFEEPPVIESLGPVKLSTGEEFECTLQYYEYGVISVLLQRAFSGDWAGLQQLSDHWMSSSLFEEFTTRLLQQRLATLGPALRHPYASWTIEDYYVFQVYPTPDVTAADLVEQHGREISQITSGETAPLSAMATVEILGARLSYYTNDLVVIGWNAAFVYDADTGAAATIHLLEYANSQLLQFRHYDELLTKEMNDVYASLQVRRGLLARRRMRPAADKLQTVVLEVTQLTEHTANALKFVGDMFSARLYRLCATRIGVVEYQEFVREKLRTAGELYGFIIEQYQQSRGFLLEVAVVVILLIELVFLFRGK